MNYLGLNSKALVISVLIHGVTVAALAMPSPFGKSEKPEFVITDVQLTSPQELTQRQSKPTPPPPVPEKEEEKPKPKPVKPKPKPEPTKEKSQPVESKTEKAPLKKEPEPEPEYEYNETRSYAEGGDKSSSSSEGFSHAEFSGSFDSPGFDYSDWNYRGFEKIARAWNNRAFSTRELYCTIHFYVLRSGRVHSIVIEKPSGNAVYDRGCKQAVTSAAPLPPLPRDFEHEEVGISLVFPYKP